MAEARAAVAELHVPANLDEGKQTWKEVYTAVRKSSKRNYYRTRNSIRNGTWPTSVSNLVAVIAICFALMYYDPNASGGLNQKLRSIANNLPLPDGAPQWCSYVFTSGCVGIAFFLVLTKVRQYILRMLLAYRGWLYENMKTQSARTVLWAICVRMVSGYQPSLYSCQRSLPRLPVPNLHSTLEKLLESLKPLTSPEELEVLRKDALTFEKGTGYKLQRILQLKSWWVPNYVSDWWEKYVYLMARSPLPINSNYYGMDQSYWTPTKDQKVRAATTIYHLLQFKRLIDREELQPMVLRSTIPICMAQYDRIFSTVRIPRKELDKLRHFDSSVSRHVIIQYKGIYYSVDAYDSRNQIICPEVFHSQIEWIIKDAHEAIESGKVSEVERQLQALTGLPRDEWAEIREEYLALGKNKESLEILESGIFIAILSDLSPESLSEKGNALLHGGGKTMWFDKSLNVTFFKNGGCGLNAEHSMADAPAIAHAWEYSMTKEIIEKWYTEDGKCMPLAKNFRQGKYKLPARLTWEVTPGFGGQILNAFHFVEKNANDLDLVIIDHVKWGKGVIKKFKVSPDAFVQTAIQLAYYRETGRFAQTYEASMTRLYLCGRTETVRSCTQENSKFIRAMEENSYTTEEKIRLFRLAAEKHQQLYRDSMNGMGIDRHLFALYIACKGFGYKSEFLEKILTRPWTLSTSQQPQQQLNNVPDSNLPLFQDKVSPGGGFGPVSDTGYGVSYMLPSDHKFFFHVASKHSCPETSSERFAGRIFQSLEDLKVLFESAKATTQNGHSTESGKNN